jgi:hypothetical protein
MDLELNGLVSIIIAVVSSSALTAAINYLANRSKNKAEVKKIEHEIVSENIDQATIIVKTAMELLEDVQKERDKLIEDKKELEKLNAVLSVEINNLKLNINKFKNKLNNDN